MSLLGDIGSTNNKKRPATMPALIF